MFKLAKNIKAVSHKTWTDFCS